MPRYAKGTDTKILHPSYRRAWLFVRGDTYYTSIHSKFVETTGIQANKKNLRLAQDILDKRLREFLFPKSSVTIREATSEFIATKTSKVALRTIEQYIAVFETYLTPEQILQDTIGIRTSIMEKLAEQDLAPNTANFHLRTLRSLFTYCVEAGHCDKNPVSSLMIPEKSAPQPKAFSDEEIVSIIKYLRAGINYARWTKQREELILLIRLLATGGLRIAEALKLTKGDLLSDGLRIDGKRSSVHKQKIRFIPFKYIPELEEICNVLRTFNTGNKVFSWNHRSKPAENLRGAMLALDIDTEGKSLHSLRKSALNRWEKELGIPEEIRNLLAGHTTAVKKSYYREHTLEDTVSAIESIKNFVRNL